MYNLTVDEAHTFFVGDGAWLVHNCADVQQDDKNPVPEYLPGFEPEPVQQYLPGFDPYENPGSTGIYGQQLLEQHVVGGESQVYMAVPSSSDNRIIDMWDSHTGIAHEAKTGYTSITTRVGEEYGKDLRLLHDPNTPVENVVWHFYTSLTTGKLGPSKPLYNLLIDAGFNVVIHGEWP
ncbi:MAG: hypothetical protein MUF87_10995 [Anaerolineae bacterium]|nr:hypothetical protein [Anaerolineae bacterium]